MKTWEVSRIECVKRMLRPIPHHLGHSVSLGRVLDKRSWRVHARDVRSILERCYCPILELAQAFSAKFCNHSQLPGLKKCATFFV